MLIALFMIYSPHLCIFRYIARKFRHATFKKEIIHMKKRSLLATMLFVPVLAVGQPGKPDSGPQDLSTAGEPAMLGVHWARDFDPLARAHEAGHGHGSANMTYHGGKIMITANTTNIFW